MVGLGLGLRLRAGLRVLGARSAGVSPGWGAFAELLFYSCRRRRRGKVGFALAVFDHGDRPGLKVDGGPFCGLEKGVVIV